MFTLFAMYVLTGGILLLTLSDHEINAFKHPMLDTATKVFLFRLLFFLVWLPILVYAEVIKW